MSLDCNSDYSYHYKTDLTQRMEGDCACAESAESSESQPIEVDKKAGTITIGNLEIHVKKGRVKVLDTETGKWIESWGDPHVKTSDGDKAQFHTDNLTFDLPGGVKITLVPTERKNPGDETEPTYLDQVSVMTAEGGVLVTGLNGDELSFEEMDSSGKLDAMHEDGTVLYVKDEIDDLYFDDDGAKALEELLGGDPDATFGEHELDGIGGKSRLDFEALEKLTCKTNEHVDDCFDIGDFEGLDVYSILFIMMGKLEEHLQGMVEELGKLNDLRRERDELEAADKNNPELKAPRFEGLDGKITKLTAKVQQLENYRQQLNTMSSNLLRSEHEQKMVTLRNIPTR